LKGWLFKVTIAFNLLLCWVGNSVGVVMSTGKVLVEDSIGRFILHARKGLHHVM
jgi:hypothetical protein